MTTSTQVWTHKSIFTKAPKVLLDTTTKYCTMDRDTLHRLNSLHNRNHIHHVSSYCHFGNVHSPKCKVMGAALGSGMASMVKSFQNYNLGLLNKTNKQSIV